MKTYTHTFDQEKFFEMKKECLIKQELTWDANIEWKSAELVEKTVECFFFLSECRNRRLNLHDGKKKREECPNRKKKIKEFKMILSGFGIWPVAILILY